LTFDDLDFKPALSGLQAIVFFENGYGASVITTREHYMYELAVLKGTIDSWNLCYDTEITSDVIPYLTVEQVTELLQRIETL